MSEKRNTADFVIRLLAISASLLIVITGLSLIVTEIFFPANDTSGAARGVADIINTVVGALIGYLAGVSRSSPKDPPSGG